MHVWIRSKISKVELLQICNSLGKKKKKSRISAGRNWVLLLGCHVFVFGGEEEEEEEEVCGVK